MMLGEAKVAAVVLFLARLLALCAAKEEQITCRPSSCGQIRDISVPFRLESDPFECGDPYYELACENNRTVMYLPNPSNYSDSWRYYVADINYKRQTIRLVDPGVEKGNCFSTPHQSMLRDLWYYLQIKGATNTIVLMNCEQPINDGNYIPITPCSSNNLTSSSSSQPQPYVYALVGGESMAAGDIKCSCTMGTTIIVQLLKPGAGASNVSMSDLQEAMLLGLDVSYSSNSMIKFLFLFIHEFYHVLISKSKIKRFILCQ